jgi:hypothetical protein
MAPKQLKAEQGVEAEEVPKRIRSKSAVVPKAGPKATPKAVPQAAPQHGHKFVAVKTEPSPEDMHVQYGEPPPVTRGPAMTKTRGALRNQFMRTITQRSLLSGIIIFSFLFVLASTQNRRQIS